jgi:hypothetical protein
MAVEGNRGYDECGIRGYDDSPLDRPGQQSPLGPHRPDYLSLTDRLKSFKDGNWPRGLPIEPEKLAEAGLYYIGNFNLYRRGRQEHLKIICIFQLKEGVTLCFVSTVTED